MLGQLGGFRGCRGVRAVLGAAMECRYSGARRGISGIRRHWGFLGGVGAIRGVRRCRGF